MSLTKEMIMSVEHEVELLADDMLRIYNTTYRKLNKEYPNSFFEFKIRKSDEELINRGLEQYTSEPFVG